MGSDRLHTYIGKKVLPGVYFSDVNACVAPTNLRASSTFFTAATGQSTFWYLVYLFSLPSQKRNNTQLTYFNGKARAPTDGTRFLSIQKVLRLLTPLITWPRLRCGFGLTIWIPYLFFLFGFGEREREKKYQVSSVALPAIPTHPSLLWSSSAWLSFPSAAVFPFREHRPL